MSDDDGDTIPTINDLLKYLRLSFIMKNLISLSDSSSEMTLIQVGRIDLKEVAKIVWRRMKI